MCVRMTKTLERRVSRVQQYVLVLSNRNTLNVLCYSNCSLYDDIMNQTLLTSEIRQRISFKNRKLANRYMVCTGMKMKIFSI